jgi:hypothetical protein
MVGKTVSHYRFNHPQFQNPIADVNSGDFGRTLSTWGSRVIQLSAKFIF